MKKGFYLFGFFLVTISLLLQLAMALIFQISTYVSLDNVYIALQKLSLLAGLFGHPVPPIVRLLLPQLLYLAILCGAAFLVLRRTWFFIKNRSFLPPASFTRGPYVIFVISAISIALFFLALISAFLWNASLRGAANMVILPATLLLPLTVCWVEFLSLKLSNDGK
jgi:hypothetical protein